MNTFYPGGASGVIFKSNLISSSVWDDILGLRPDRLSKSNVNVNSLIRRKNKCIGNFGSVLKNTAIKWFSQIWIARSAAFFNVPPEELTGCLLHGSNCISLGHWMICYKTNEFLDLITSF